MRALIRKITGGLVLPQPHMGRRAYYAHPGICHARGTDGQGSTYSGPTSKRFSNLDLRPDEAVLSATDNPQNSARLKRFVAIADDLSPTSKSTSAQVPISPSTNLPEFACRIFQSIPGTTPATGLGTITNAPMDLRAMNLQWIPGGKFDFGPTGYDLWGCNVERRYGIVVPGFYIFAQKVTESVLQQMLDGPLGYRPEGEAVPSAYVGEHLPAVRVNKYLAQDYVDWLNKQTDVQGMRHQLSAVTGKKWSFDLPSNYQWEKAVKGPSGIEYIHLNNAEVVLSNIGGVECVTPINLNYEPNKLNGFGLHDMMNGVREWTRSNARFRSSHYINRGVGDRTPRRWQVPILHMYSNFASESSTNLGFRLVLCPQKP